MPTNQNNTKKEKKLNIRAKTLLTLMAMLFIAAPVIHIYITNVMKFISKEQQLTFWIVLPIALTTWIIPFTIIPLWWLRPIQAFLDRRKEERMDKKFLQKVYKSTMSLPLKVAAILSISWFLGPWLCNLYGLFGTPLTWYLAIQFPICAWITGFWVGMIGFLIISKVTQPVLQLLQEKGLTAADIEASGAIKINIGLRLKTFFVVLISVAVLVVGYLAYVKFGATFKEALVVIVFGIIMIIIAVILGHLASRSITDPLKQLVLGAKRVSAGDLTTRVPIGSRDEIGILAVSFNQMTEDLSKSRSELAKSDIYLEALGEAVMALNMDRKVVKVNKAGLELWDYTLDEITKLTFEDVFPKKEHQKHYAEMEKAVTTGTVRPFETLILTKNGEEIPVLLSGTAILDATGKPTGFVCVSRDMRETQRLIKELEKARANLEIQVVERTKELRDKIKELEKFNKLAVGRELKMVELKEEIERLKKELEETKGR